MDRTGESSSSFRKCVNPLNERREEEEEEEVKPAEIAANSSSQLFRLSKGSGWCPIELLMIILLFTDSITPVRFALCCRWLFQEISNWSEHWKKRYCQVFPFDRDNKELEWLQQFIERRRPTELPTIRRASKTSNHHHHTTRKARKERPQVEVNWFRAYCCRHQTKSNLSRFIPFSERIVSLPPEYHRKGGWTLLAANSRYQLFQSNDCCSLITFRPSNYVRQTSDVSKLDDRLTTKDFDNNDYFCRLDWDKTERVDRYVCANRDAVLVTVDRITWSIWSNGRHPSLKVQWPLSSDNDSYTPRKWEVIEVQQGWILAWPYETYNQHLTCIFNVNHARWCGGVVTTDMCHFQMTTQDIVQAFYCFEEKVNGCIQSVTYQLWEYRTDKPNERCLKSETITPNMEGLYHYWIGRLDDKQSVVVLSGTNPSSHPTNLSLYRTNVDLSFSFLWRKEILERVRSVKCVPSREEMVVITSYSNILYVLNISNGTVLREIKQSFRYTSIHPLLGSLCSYWAINHGHRLVDTQTRRSYSLKGESTRLGYISSKYGMLCAEEHVKDNRLTLLDWHSL